MNRRTLIPVFLILSLLSVGYAIYRSIAPTITTSGGGQQVVYGAPQHGLTLGLCLFGGLCVLAAALLHLVRDEHPREEPPRPYTSSTTRTATNYPQTQR